MIFQMMVASHIFVGLVDIRSAFQQQMHDALMAFVSCPNQRRAFLLTVLIVLNNLKQSIISIIHVSIKVEIVLAQNLAINNGVNENKIVVINPGVDTVKELNKK